MYRIQKKSSYFFVNLVVCFLFLLGNSTTQGFCEDSAKESLTSRGEQSLSLDEIISKVEERYAVPGFSVQFFQEAVLKAMDITAVQTDYILYKLG